VASVLAPYSVAFAIAGSAVEVAWASEQRPDSHRREPVVPRRMGVDNPDCQVCPAVRAELLQAFPGGHWDSAVAGDQLRLGLVASSATLQREFACPVAQPDADQEATGASSVEAYLVAEELLRIQYRMRCLVVVACLRHQGVVELLRIQYRMRCLVVVACLRHQGVVGLLHSQYRMRCPVVLVRLEHQGVVGLLNIRCRMRCPVVSPVLPMETVPLDFA